MTYLLAKTLDEALDRAATPGTVILAGGTDFYPTRVGRPLTDDVVDITGVAELTGLSEQPGAIRIGALTSWSQIRDAELPDRFHCLQLAAGEVGGVQVQNAGTIGGNLCNASPAADGIPPLLALDASVEIASAASGTRTLPLEDFLLGYRSTDLRSGEILTAVLVPMGDTAARSTFLKLGSRRYLVISIAMVAALLEVSGGSIVSARVAVGACSPVAQRLRGLEEQLAGEPADAGIADLVSPEHLGELSPIDDPRAPAAYRMDAALTLVKRALTRCAA